MADIYRPAASILLLRPAGRSYELLLLHKPRKKDAWQLPQGGMEQGESLEEAAVRELHEEAGIKNPKIIGASREVYKYDFPPSFRRFRPDNVCGQKIGYVFALTEAGMPVTVDDKEVDEFVWVDIDSANTYLKRKEYMDLIKRLYDEALIHASTLPRS